MSSDRDEWIAKRAYEIWEQSGKPSGSDSEHWAQATAEWESGPAVASDAPKTDSWDDEEE